MIVDIIRLFLKILCAYLSKYLLTSLTMNVNELEATTNA
jgi:hypothetical protein